MSMLNGYSTPQVSQAAVNVQQAFAMVGPVIQQLTMSGNITQQEGQTILTVMNQPAQAQGFQQRIYQTFGETAMAPQVLQQTVMNIILNAAQRIRQSQQNVPPATNYSFANTGYQPMPQNQYPQQPQVGFNASGTYGNPQQTTGAFNPYPEPSPQAAPAPSQPAVPVEPQKRMPTNAPIDIDLTDDYRVFGAPIWTPIPQQEILPYHTVLEVVTDCYGVVCGRCDVNTATVRLETPFASPEGAVADVAVNHPEIMDPEKTFADVIIFKQIVIGRMSFDPAKDLYLKCCKAMQNEPGTTGVLKVMTILGERKDAAASLLSNIVLEQFNNAASVNFMKANATNTGMQRLRPFESMSQLSRLVVDSGDYEEWIADKESFARALKSCLKVSFNRIFNPDGLGYLDISADSNGNPNDNRARLLVMSDERFGFRFTSGDAIETSRMYPFLPSKDKEASEALRDAITSKMKTVFPLILERKILVHNLNLPTIAPGNFSAEWLHHTPESLILADFFNKHGSMETICVNDTEQLRHPLMLGIGYQDQLLVRRV